MLLTNSLRYFLVAGRSDQFVEATVCGNTIGNCFDAWSGLKVDLAPPIHRSSVRDES